MTTIVAAALCALASSGLCEARPVGGFDFNGAVERCASAGGGVVTVPRGHHVSNGPIVLKSNVELHLAEGAVIEFSDDPKDYLPAVRVAYGGVECYNYSPLVYAYGATNVAVTGKGTLRARHAFWYAWQWLREESVQARLTLNDNWSVNGVPVEKRIMTDLPGSNLRPQFLHFNRCRNVRIEDVTIRDSPLWCIHTYACDGVVVRNVDVCAHIHNSDGIDLEMTKNALVEGCTFCQGDDAICVKAGKNADGRRVGICSENIEIRNCEIKAGHQLLAIGSEVSAGIRNVWLHDCRMSGATSNGLLIKTNKERGGFVEDIRFERVTAKHLEGAPVAISADTYYSGSSRNSGQEVMRTRIRNVRVKDVVAEEAARVYSLKGDPEMPVEGVVLENVSVRHPGSVENISENIRGLVISGESATASENSIPCWLSVMPLAEDDVDGVASDAVAQGDETIVDGIAWITRLCPEGKPAADIAAQYAAAYRKIEPKVRSRSRMKQGVLLQSTMGHGGYPGETSEYQVVAKPTDKVEVDEGCVRISRDDSVVKVLSDLEFSLTKTDRGDRAFSPIAGFLYAYLAAPVAGGREFSVRISVETKGHQGRQTNEHEDIRSVSCCGFRRFPCGSAARAAAVPA